MNKTAIKNFSIWARNKLIEDITYRAGLIGVSEKGIAQPLSQSTKDLQFFDIGTKDYAQVAGKEIEQRNGLVKAIKEKERDLKYADAFKAVIEEIAYTWFNRLVAIRFMEVNDYLPSRVRVLSSENPAKNEPDFVTAPFDTDLEFTSAEQDRIMQLKDENKLDELFRMLFIKQCNKLNEILPEMFEQTSDYTELLLSISFTDNDGIVYHLTHDIDESDWQDQVQIIGWLYQYYNTELKDDTFALLKKNIKITKERIPAATQLFTPDWIVRYMVENSLGRLWIEGHPNNELKENWKYYLEEAEQESDVQVQLEKIRAEYSNLNPEDIKVIDPCMGSGHILVYCFDVLMQIYESQGYTQRDAAQSIVKNNLFGLDIDKRAAQLAYFAVMMKARQYDRRFFDRKIAPNVYVICGSNGIDKYAIEYFCNGDKKLASDIDKLVNEMFDATEYGSILNISQIDFKAIYTRFTEIEDEIDLYREIVLRELLPLVRVAEVMSNQYDVVATNPPYMASNNFNPKLSAFIKEYYPTAKEDLYSCFIERCNAFCKKNALVSMITMESWMFNASFEKFRRKTLQERTILSLIHMPYLGKGGTSLGISFGTSSFVLRKNCNFKYNGYYSCIRYFETDDEGIPLAFPTVNEKTNLISQRELEAFPGMTVSYWAGKHTIDIFQQEKSISEGYGDARQGLKTSDNNRFLRRWHEVDFNKIGFGCKNAEIALTTGCKWFPYNKGGKFQKWYGNDEYVIDWSENGTPIKNAVCERYPYLKGNYSFVVKNESKYFLEQVTWTTLTSGKLSFRYKPFGYLFDGTGSSIFNLNSDILIYLLGLLNSTTGEYLIGLLGQTMSYEVGMIGKVPVIYTENNVSDKVQKCIDLCQDNWDMQETSWNFKSYPMIKTAPSVKELVNQYIKTVCEQKELLDKNEQAINDFYGRLYGIDLSAINSAEEVDEGYESISVPSESTAIKQLLSYVVGCIFGRYSLDHDGLVFAGGKWDSTKYSSFNPDKDNCIPLTDEEYFEDDIVGMLCTWLKTIFGESGLEDNLDYIADALGNKGVTSREIIRNYFLKDFFTDHCRMYQKRPVYWLFDGGKQNGFKALVYMHRWDADTVGNLRVEYLHKIQHTYEREIQRMQETIADGRDAREISKATKRKDKLQKQLKETKDYDAKLAHIALSRIEIDLDDGVKVNYEKVQTGRDGKKMQILAKI